MDPSYSKVSNFPQTNCKAVPPAQLLPPIVPFLLIVLVLLPPLYIHKLNMLILQTRSVHQDMRVITIPLFFDVTRNGVSASSPCSVG